MNFRFLTVLTAVIIILASTITGLSANSVSVGKNISHIAVNPVNGNLAFGTFDESSNIREMIITDSDLNVIQSFEIPYGATTFDFSFDGQLLVVGLYDFSSHSQTNAEFQVYNTTTWQTVNSVSLPEMPIELCMSKSNNTSYLTCGYSYYQNITLVKHDLDNPLNSIECSFGEAPAGGIALNDNETKLYVYDNKTYKTFGAEFKVIDRDYKLRVFDTQTLNEIDIIVLDNSKVLQIAVGGPNRILLANGDTPELNPELITVIDTSSDTVEKSIIVNGCSGCKYLVYEPLSNFAYAVVLQRDYYIDPETGLELFRFITGNRVAIIDISTDQVTWTPEFPELVGPIALSPDGTRLYAGSALPESELVFYLDL